MWPAKRKSWKRSTSFSAEGRERGRWVARLDQASIRSYEPQCARHRSAPRPSTAIVDFRAVTSALAADLARAGAEVRLRSKVVDSAPTRPM